MLNNFPNCRGFLLLLWTALTLLIDNGLCGHSYLRQRLEKPEEIAAARSYLSQVVKSSSESLRMPPILEPNTTPREYIDTEQSGQDSRIIIGLIVENYSKYRLTDPRTSGTNDCKANREVLKQT